MTATTLSLFPYPLTAYSAQRAEPARNSQRFAAHVQELAQRWGLSQAKTDAPGLVRPKAVEQAPEATGGLGDMLRCAETGRWHKPVPDAVRADIDDCNALISMARSHEYDKGCCNAPKDAFALDVNGDPYYEGFSEARSLMPESLLTDPRLNRGLNSEDDPAGTLRSGGGANTLFDPKTGFAAAIGLRQVTGAAEGATREVIIAFGPLSSQGGWLAQAVRCAMNLLGLNPPGNFKQAAELARQVKAHLDEVNGTLPAGAPKFKLRLTGHSMGGAMATYAAAKNAAVDALVFNPMRLGALTRADVGKEALKALPENVTEVVVQTDWLSDNRLAAALRWTPNSVGALGTRYLVPVPTKAQVKAHHINGAKKYGFSDAQVASASFQATLKRFVNNFSVHNDFAMAVNIYLPEVSPEPSLVAQPPSDLPDLEPDSEAEEPSVVRCDSASTIRTSDEFSDVDDELEPAVVRITHVGGGFFGADARDVAE